MTITTAEATANFTSCVICGATDIPAEGKHMHFCVVRNGRKVISREYIGWYDGRPVTYSSDFNVAYTDLNDIVRETLEHTAVVTADQEAERPCPTCGGEGDCPDCGTLIATCDSYGCDAPARHIATLDGDVLNGWYHVCCLHYARDFGARCTHIDPPADPDPGPEPWPTVFRPIVAPALLAEADAALTNGPCLACGRTHFIQSCPEIRALLMAPDASTVAQIYIDRFLAEVA